MRKVIVGILICTVLALLGIYVAINFENIWEYVFSGWTNGGIVGPGPIEMIL